MAMRFRVNRMVWFNHIIYVLFTSFTSLCVCFHEIVSIANSCIPACFAQKSIITPFPYIWVSEARKFPIIPFIR